MGEPFGEGPVARTVLLCVCIWETVALTTGKIPTISAVARARPRKVRAAAVAAASGWLAAHFLHPRWP